MSRGQLNKLAYTCVRCAVYPKHGQMVRHKPTRGGVYKVHFCLEARVAFIHSAQIA